MSWDSLICRTPSRSLPTLAADPYRTQLPIRSFNTAMICSSLNLLRFIVVRLLCVGLYQKPVTFQGSTSAYSSI